MNKELSVVIVNYNVKPLLRLCVTSLYEHIRGISFEVVVVDNHSTDGSNEMIRDEFPQVKLIKNNYNAGFAHANNHGIAVSEGNCILVLNPDTVFIDDSFFGMLDFVKEKGGNVLVAPRLLNTDGSLQNNVWRDLTVGFVILELFFLDRLFTFNYPIENYTQPQRVDYVTGAAMLFSKNLVERVGVFRPVLFWVEDVDLCFRIRQNGGEVYYFPGTSIVHHGGQSSRKELQLFYSNANLSKVKYFRKKGRLYGLIGGLAVLGFVLSRLLFFFIFVSG